MADDATAVPVTYAWKFKIPIATGPRSPEWRQDPENPSASYSGCLAVVLAATEEEARATVRQFAAEKGEDSRWLVVADVIQIELLPGTPQLLTFAQF